MLFIAYAFICFILFWIIEFLALNIGGLIGAGPYDAGLVVSAISILCIVVIVCTGLIINTINKINKK